MNVIVPLGLAPCVSVAVSLADTGLGPSTRLEGDTLVVRFVVAVLTVKGSQAPFAM